MAKTPARAKNDKARDTKPRLEVRQAMLKDVRAIQALGKRAYPDMQSYSQAQLRGQIQNFPEGQFVAIYDDTLVGFAATFLIDEATALKAHDWVTITGNGYASRHDEEGDIALRHGGDGRSALPGAAHRPAPV